MDIRETESHSFIVKIWREETAEEAGEAMWRGHITHVPSGQRRYFQALDDVSHFIAPYLAAMGVSRDDSWQRKSWWKRLTAFVARRSSAD